MSLDNLKIAAYLAVALLPALVLHEYAHAFAADRLGDPSPRRWGRLTFNPRALVDPFGTLILPALALILVAGRGGSVVPLFAYAKPMPRDDSALRNPPRDSLIVTLAGLGANVALVFLGGMVVRLGATGEVEVFAQAWMIVNALMFAIQLMPIPGLDGSRLLARVLPPRAREVYVNLSQYLVLFILVAFFLLSGPLIAIVDGFAQIVCNAASGADCLL
ncbi:MAG TPA: site-2 protease family protein [Actinomycetota bacterium]|nr:site-2 protease family protein [Actinomycetota bacterium]